MNYIPAFIATLIGFMLTCFIGLMLFPIPEGQKAMDFQTFVILSLLLHIIMDLKQIKK